MLSRLGVSDVNALVRLYPRVYEDWSRIKSINEAQIGEICCIKGIVGSPVHKSLIRKGLTLYKTEITDGSGIMGITIFNSRFAAEDRAPAKPYVEPLTPVVNEAFIIDGGVNYDVQVWPMPRRSDRRVLARVMSYEYLWHNIREVGGAYGTGMLSADGVEYLYTYRDPHMKESYETFAKGPAELAAREYTEKDLNELIVGTAAKLDTPRKPSSEARETDRRYFCGITNEMAAAERQAMCDVDGAWLKAQAAALTDAMQNSVRVAFGSKEAVEAAKDLFDTVETL